MRLLILGFLVMAAAQLSAQIVLNINDSTVADEFLAIRYDVDHGSTPTAVQIDVSITTASPDGLLVEVYQDWDAFVAGTGAYGSDDIFGAGTVAYTVTTAARAGVHPVILLVGSQSFSDAAAFNGTVAFSVAGVTASAQGKHRFFKDGLYHSLCGVIADFTTFDAKGTTTYTVKLDAGPSSQTFNVRIVTQGLDVERIRLSDSTGTVHATYDAVGGQALGQGVYQVTASGNVSLILRATGGNEGAYYIGRFFVPSTVTITSVSGKPEGGGGNGGSDGGGCAAGGAGLPAMLAAGVIAVWARRRKAG